MIGLRQAIIDDVRMQYKQKVYVEGIDSKIAIQQIAKYFGLTEAKVANLVKSIDF
jgi:hypothetical protein